MMNAGLGMLSPREARQVALSAAHQAQHVERPVGAHRETPLSLTITEAPLEAVRATLERLRAQVACFAGRHGERHVVLGRCTPGIVDRVHCKRRCKSRPR